MAAHPPPAVLDGIVARASWPCGPGRGEPVVDRPRRGLERSRPEPAGRAIGREHADRVGPERPGEVRVALGHRRTDECPDVQPGREHRPAERDAVGDVGGEDQDVGTSGRELTPQVGEPGHDEVVAEPGDDGRAGRLAVRAAASATELA